MIELLMAVVPLLLLLGLLLCGFYPGHGATMRLVARIAARSRLWTRPARAAARPRVQHPGAVRGGLLIAFRLAQRPPPLAA